MVTARARRELVRWMRDKGLSERHGLEIVGMSASSLRYQPRPDRNHILRERIIALAQRYRRYGVGLIYLKLRQAGNLVNYKRVERLYGLRGRTSHEDLGRHLLPARQARCHSLRQRPGIYR